MSWCVGGGIFICGKDLYIYSFRGYLHPRYHPPPPCTLYHNQLRAMSSSLLSSLNGIEQRRTCVELILDQFEKTQAAISQNKTKKNSLDCSMSKISRYLGSKKRKFDYIHAPLSDPQITFSKTAEPARCDSKSGL